MKIIGYTARNYILEADIYDIRAIAGNHAPDYASNTRDRLPIGTEIKVQDTFTHLHRISYDSEERRRIVDSLRASATLLENTPSPLTLPEPESHE